MKQYTYYVAVCHVENFKKTSGNLGKEKKVGTNNGKKVYSAPCVVRPTGGRLCNCILCF